MTTAQPPVPEPAIDDLRREIDQIDDAIHDLLMRRTQVAEQIGAAKGPERIYLRPGREAVILRRLVARHTGPLPVGVLVRIWREIISALTRLQGPFAVAVFAPEDRRGYWDVARDHFGSYTPMVLVNTPVAALRAITEGTATVGVVPIPDEGDADPWWRFLMSADAKTPKVVARLPFAGRGNGRSESRDALAIAPIAHDPTGDDRTLIGLELAQDVSRGRLKDAFDAAGLPPTAFCSWYGRETAAGSLHLVEVGDYVDPRDPRLKVLADRMGDPLVRLNAVGGYAVPLGLSPDTRKT